MPNPQIEETNWKAAFGQSSFRYAFGATVASFILIFGFFIHFVGYVETRPGVVLADPFLARLPALELDWPIFTIVYGAIVLAFFVLFKRPRRFLLVLQAYTLMVALRIIAMDLVPLEPPTGMIILADPFAKMISGSGAPLTRDLFFSGHTATCFLMYLGVEKPAWAKRVLLALVVGVASGVLLQHVHYSIDVFAAPFFAYAAFHIAQMLPAARS
jgi:hypothetical protein